MIFRRAAKAAAALALTGLSSAYAVHPAVAAPEQPATQFTLENGMQVVVVPDHRVPIVAHSVWYKVGGADDGPGLSGRAHFLEHMMFKATMKYPKRHLDQAVARAGGFNNATTSVDVTNYYEVIPKEHLAEMMAYEADRMTNIQFTDDEFETERGAILQERKMRVDSSPLSRLREKMRAALYAGTPYEKLPAGTQADIRATTTKSAYELYRSKYRPGNAVVVVAGDVSKEEVERLAKETFGLIPAMDPVPQRLQALELKPIPPDRIIESDPQVPFPGMGYSYRIPAEDHEDYYPLLALMNYLNIYTGRLNTVLVREKKVASIVNSDLEVNRLGGIFGIGASVSPGTELSVLEKELDAIIADIRENGAPEAEIAAIVQSWGPVLVFDRDDIIARMNHYGTHAANGRSLEWIFKGDTLMSRVTVADIKRVASRYLVPENRVTGVLLPALPVPENVSKVQ